MVLRLAALLVSLGTIITVSTLYSFNQFARFEDGDISHCDPVTGIAGPEDLQIDHKRGLAFISSQRRAVDGRARGGVHVVAIDDPLASGAWRDRTGGVPEDFAPEGVSYYEDSEVRRLFVVNSANRAVELFDVTETNDLVHLESLADPRVTSPNDVLAVGPRAFYVTNDVSAGRGSLIGRLQFLGRAGAGSIYAFDGVAWRQAAGGLKFANGLAMQPDGETLYVGESAGMTLTSFARDVETGFLTLKGRVPLPGAAQNINVDANGAVLVAATPKPLGFVFRRRASDTRAPSLIIEYLDPDHHVLADGLDPRDAIRPILRTGAKGVATLTTADRLGRRMLVGGLAEDRFLICETGV